LSRWPGQLAWRAGPTGWPGQPARSTVGGPPRAHPKEPGGEPEHTPRTHGTTQGAPQGPRGSPTAHPRESWAPSTSPSKRIGCASGNLGGYLNGVVVRNALFTVTTTHNYPTTTWPGAFCAVRKAIWRRVVVGVVVVLKKNNYFLCLKRNNYPNNYPSPNSFPDCTERTGPGSGGVVVGSCYNEQSISHNYPCQICFFSLRNAAGLTRGGGVV